MKHILVLAIEMIPFSFEADGFEVFCESIP